MSNATLGSWRNPPLAYVVAELVISPYYSMANAIPGLQDKLPESAYARTIEGQELVVDGGKPSTQPIWRLMSPDQKHGVQLGTRSIALHATSYLHSNDLSQLYGQRFLTLLNWRSWVPLSSVLGFAISTSLFPQIIACRLRNPTPRLQGIIPEGAVSTASMWAAAFQFEGTIVNLRAAAPTPKGLLLPPEFNALPLHKPRVMLDAEKRLKDDKPIGFVDTDCLNTI